MLVTTYKNHSISRASNWIGSVFIYCFRGYWSRQCKHLLFMYWGFSAQKTRYSFWNIDIRILKIALSYVVYCLATYYNYTCDLLVLPIFLYPTFTSDFSSKSSKSNGTILIFKRSGAGFILNLHIFEPNQTRESLQMSKDLYTKQRPGHYLKVWAVMEHIIL